VTVEEILRDLRQHGDSRNLEGLTRFGIRAQAAYGVPTPYMQKLAKKLGKNHELAQKLWATGVREARHVAAYIDPVELVTPGQMDRWARDFDSWDLVDSVTGHLFAYTPHAWRKAMLWPHREAEYVRRAGFALMAWLAVHDKQSADELFLPFFGLIRQYATDERNYVHKAVSWALRQIGKRNVTLRAVAIEIAEDLRTVESSSARAIAAEALRELKGKKPSEKKAAVKKAASTTIPQPVSRARKRSRT
jgi:3-methyladenine DNA glycosylase AlkD